MVVTLEQRCPICQGKSEDGCKPAGSILAGVVLGLAVSAALSRFLVTFLYGAQGWDPKLAPLAAISLATTAFLASVVPAHQIPAKDGCRACGLPALLLAVGMHPPGPRSRFQGGEKSVPLCAILDE
jgi:hypothetical protein